MAHFYGPELPSKRLACRGPAGSAGVETLSEETTAAGLGGGLAAGDRSARRARATRVLYIDIEGGRGGSSRSLYYMARELDRGRVSPTIWFRRDDGYGRRLAAARVDHRHEPDIVSVIPRTTKNWKLWLVAAPKFAGLWGVARRIRDFAPDILHLNYEGLVPLSMIVRRLAPSLPIVLHVRTTSPPNAVYRAYARHINRSVDHLIFISERNRDVSVSAGVNLDAIPHTIAYNPVDPALLSAPRRLSDGKVLRVVYLGTIDHVRAPDRMVELASIFQARNAPIHIEVFGGAPRYRKLLIFRLRNLERLRKMVERAGLGDWITVHGRVEDPDARLLAADILVRPGREDNPWGRDIIEALAAGVPVVAHGDYDRFVQNGKTGILMPQWDAGAIADAVVELARDVARLRRMSDQSRRLAAKLFDAPGYARTVMSIYDQVLDNCSRRS